MPVDGDTVVGVLRAVSEAMRAEGVDDETVDRVVKRLIWGGPTDERSYVTRSKPMCEGTVVYGSPGFRHGAGRCATLVEPGHRWCDKHKPSGVDAVRRVVTS